MWIENKTTVYYLFHGGALASLLMAGALGAVNGGYARLDKAGRLALWVLIFSSLLWTLMAYEWDEMLSPAVLAQRVPSYGSVPSCCLQGWRPRCGPVLGACLMP